MSNGSLYCTFCGLPFDAHQISAAIVPHDCIDSYAPWAYDDHVINEKQVAWIDDFRLMTTKEDLIPKDNFTTLDYNVEISVPAFWGEYERVRIEGEITEYAVYGSPSQPGFIFRVPAHDACLKIAHEVMKWRLQNFEHPSDQDSPGGLLHLYNSIAERKKDRPYEPNMWFNNGYYGAMQYWGQPWSCELGGEWMVADPIKIPSLTNEMILKLGPFEYDSEQERSVFSRNQDLSQLEKLPSPAIDKILENLDWTSIESLRCCSISACNAFKPTGKFWKDRVLDNRVVPWLWDLDKDLVEKIEVKVNWEGLVRSLNKKHLFENEELPIGLRNRIRISKVVLDIVI
ncbi:hypothetical protein H072_3955 [Dactylellina haptotyla CBS 200.50]|uniref:F-box domain-containing protein n=1 Tax=Dactylellina haptotyla (strain CBS 200.50) TaxID=1284197 RepID=S8BRQ6_DACHA|nr:hypothetical protein H072_3955 [Dactylellina haptotyla CBS 200.50]